MDTNERIQYSVAFKGVIDLLAAEVIVPETDDIVMEVIALTDEFNEALEVKTGASQGGKASSAKPTRRSRATASTQRGSSSDNEQKDFTPKNPDADASDAQIKALKSLMKNAGYDFDRQSFAWGDEDIYWDELTMGNVQIYFDELKG